MYQTILFDLDGTLTDSGMGIQNSVVYALKQMQREIPSQDNLKSFIGPPLQTTFKELLGMSELECQEAVTLYRQYFSDKGIYENEVYAGIPELLESLQENGKTVILATSKPKVFAEKI